MKMEWAYTRMWSSTYMQTINIWGVRHRWFYCFFLVALTGRYAALPNSHRAVPEAAHLVQYIPHQRICLSGPRGPPAARPGQTEGVKGPLHLSSLNGAKYFTTPMAANGRQCPFFWIKNHYNENVNQDFIIKIDHQLSTICTKRCLLNCAWPSITRFGNWHVMIVNAWQPVLIAPLLPCFFGEYLTNGHQWPERYLSPADIVIIIGLGNFPSTVTYFGWCTGSW